MIKKIKDSGGVLLGLGFFVSVSVAFAFIIIGGAKLFELIFPILIWVNFIVWSVVSLLLLFSVVPRFRDFTGKGICLGAFISLVMLWFFSIYATYTLWGFVGIFIGIVLAGFGFFFTAILALLFNGEFREALMFALNILVNIAILYLGFWIITKHRLKQINKPEPK